MPKERISFGTPYNLAGPMEEENHEQKVKGVMG